MAYIDFDNKDVCPICGSLYGDIKRHKEWHKKVGF